MRDENSIWEPIDVTGDENSTCDPVDVTANKTYLRTNSTSDPLQVTVDEKSIWEPIVENTSWYRLEVRGHENSARDQIEFTVGGKSISERIDVKGYEKEFLRLNGH